MIYYWDQVAPSSSFFIRPKLKKSIQKHKLQLFNSSGLLFCWKKLRNFVSSGIAESFIFLLQLSTIYILKEMLMKIRNLMMHFFNRDSTHFSTFPSVSKHLRILMAFAKLLWKLLRNCWCFFWCNLLHFFMWLGGG